MDDFTPREVWQEYEARKGAIDGVLSVRIGELYRQRDRDVEDVADLLGCGVPEHLLTPAQRIEQRRAIRRWREASGCTG